MPNIFNSKTPIYIQLVNIFKHKIVSGDLLPGAKLESVRDLAIKYEVNPNTMQRALSELEKDELVFSERTSGRYITENKELIHKMKKNVADEIIENFIIEMNGIGYSTKDTLILFNSLIKEEN